MESTNALRMLLVDCLMVDRAFADPTKFPLVSNRSTLGGLRVLACQPRVASGEESCGEATFICTGAVSPTDAALYEGIAVLQLESVVGGVRL